jgi:hypothetical protein
MQHELAVRYVDYCRISGEMVGRRLNRSGAPIKVQVPHHHIIEHHCRNLGTHPSGVGSFSQSRIRARRWAREAAASSLYTRQGERRGNYYSAPVSLDHSCSLTCSSSGWGDLYLLDDGCHSPSAITWTRVSRLRSRQSRPVGARQRGPR